MIDFLIVDDIQLNRLLLEKVLRSEWQCQTAMTGNGNDALREVGEHRPDRIFLDVMMPGMDGTELLK